jgi:hypothetical protein
MDNDITQAYKMFIQNPKYKDYYLGDPTVDATSTLKLTLKNIQRQEMKVDSSGRKAGPHVHDKLTAGFKKCL